MDRSTPKAVAAYNPRDLLAYFAYGFVDRIKPLGAKVENWK